MPTFDPLIPPWLAIGSCIGFTFMFVGSLYIFPVKAKQPREHARYSFIPPLPLRSASVATAAPSPDTPLSSPRPSSSSSVSTSTANNSNTVANSSTGSTTTTSIIATKSPTSADSRAHRSSTHLYFIEHANTISNATTATNIPSSTSSPAILASSNFNSPPSSSTALSASAASALLASVPSVSARPEVAIHHHGSSLPYDQSPLRWQNQQQDHWEQQPVTPVELQKLDRDHPLVIMQRFKGILLTSFLVPLYLWWLFKFSGAIPNDQSFWTRLGQFLGLLGIAFPGSVFELANHIVIPLMLVGMLFMGPVLMMFLSNELPFQQAFDWASQRRHLRGPIGIRNFIVGPISEEFIFRACMVAIVSQSGSTFYAMVFGLPLVFGIAHIHHGYEHYAKKGRTRHALFNAALTACFQFLYTTLFGWFATFLFVRTSSMIGPCLCHSFCNMMGFPDVTNIQYFGRWKYWLYLAFATGMTLFGVLLGPLTNPELYGGRTSLAYWGITMGPTTSAT